MRSGRVAAVLVLCGAAMLVACGGGDEASTDTTQAAAAEPRVSDEENDCVDASNGEPVPDCPTPAMDILAVSFEAGSLVITFEFADPGPAALGTDWEASLVVDVDGDVSTGSRRTFMISGETIGTDFEVRAKPQPDQTIAPAAAVWQATSEQPLATFSAADGLVARLVDDRTLEIVVPDAVLSAVQDLALGDEAALGAPVGIGELAAAPLGDPDEIDEPDDVPDSDYYACLELFNVESRWDLEKSDREKWKDCLYDKGYRFPDGTFFGRGRD